MPSSDCALLSGNEAVARAAFNAGVALGTGYPGTPSTEILENFSLLGGKAQWAPNEKVAFEVGLGVAFSGARALVTMKHVGVNVAADPLFTATYTGVSGALVLISADDPGMHSSQNEQDNRNYARAAGIPMFEPSDSQETYDMFLEAVRVSEEFKLPAMIRTTTRVCHSKGIVRFGAPVPPPVALHFDRDIAARLMLPGNARPAHRRLREKLAEIDVYNERSPLNAIIHGDTSLGIIASGVAFMHAREAAPDASFLKIGMSYPLPMNKIRAFVELVDRCIVIEEGDPYLTTEIRAAGFDVESKAPMYRFGELNVNRVRNILAGDTTPETPPPPGRPPRLCPECPHRTVFGVLNKIGCIVAGDIGCYTLGGRPPFNAMDTCVCMGSSIGIGLGLRHALPDEEARRVVSVIGDSTFMHSGLTGMAEMVYNPPETGHVLIVLDNGTTAMTGMQEHPGTGRTLDHEPTNKIVIEDVARAMGIKNIHVIDPREDRGDFREIVEAALASGNLELIVARRPCALAAKKIEAYEAAAVAKREAQS